MYIRKWKSFLLYIKVIERIKDKYNSKEPIFNWTENVCNTIKDGVIVKFISNHLYISLIRLYLSLFDLKIDTIDFN